MSKTIDTQIEKSTRLIEGLKAHIAELQDKGINASELDNMANQLKQLKESADTADEIRAKLSKQVRQTNSILTDCKRAYMEAKSVIRNNYLQEEWAKYGVTDKR